MENSDLQNQLAYLQTALKRQPNNLDLLNKLGLFYNNNPKLKSDSKDDYIYLKQAYNTKKTVKSCHNLAWCLFFKWTGEGYTVYANEQIDCIETAFRIQEECIQLKPKSYYPYALYGYMWFNLNDYPKALHYLDIAYKKHPSYNIAINLGFCYSYTEDYKQAEHYFKEAVKLGDHRDKALLNLALVYAVQQRYKLLQELIDTFEQKIATIPSETITYPDLAYLFYAVGNTQKSKDYFLGSYLRGISFLGDSVASYVLYKENRLVWKKVILDNIQEYQANIQEILADNHSKWQLDDLAREKDFMAKHQALLESTPSVPILKPLERLNAEYCGCLLFDCPEHDSLNDD